MWRVVGRVKSVTPQRGFRYESRATTADWAVPIRTFTFLADPNAPEARKLRKLLRAAGYDYHRLGLGELSTYVRGEVPDDPRLHTIFAEAGCDHLLELNDQEEGAYASQGNAQ